jgi:phage baseplate assembly protein V
LTTDLAKVFNSIKVKIACLLSRAVVTLVDDSKKMQELQLSILEGETRGGIERVQNYGFTSVPLPGAEAVTLFVGGHRDHGLAVAVDDRRYRLTGLQEGEVALYHKDGAKILLKSDGTVEVTADQIKLAGSSSSAILGETFKDLYNEHTHTSGAVGVATSPPIAPLTETVLSSKVKLG